MSLRFYGAAESKAFRLIEVFGLTGPIQRGTLRWGDRLGSSHALRQEIKLPQFITAILKSQNSVSTNIFLI